MQVQQRLREIIGFVIALCVLFSLPMPASADTVHTVRFASAPIVMVWGDAEVYRASDVPVMTGQLLADTQAAAGLSLVGGQARHTLRFQVASNAPFDIVASQYDGDLRAEFILRRVSTAPNAVAAERAVVATGPLHGAPELSIYTAPGKTAARPGAPRTQAHSYELSYQAKLNSPALRLSVRPAL